MNGKHNICSWFCIIAFLFLLGRPPAVMAITADELADICQAMESAIADISLEYEWYNDSPLTLEEELKSIAGTGLLLDVDIPRFKFSAARSLSARDPNDPNSPLFDRLLLEQSMILINEHRDILDTITKASRKGKITTQLSMDKGPASPVTTTAIISETRDFILPINLTPIGFSILRFPTSRVTEKTPLSAMLRRKEIIRLDGTVRKVNGFNTIRADFLTTDSKKQVYLHAYFSVDHGYTPVRYEFMTGGEPQFKRVAITVDVNSLEQVAEGLWFPGSGTMRDPDSEEKNVYRAVSRIVVNQGLTDEHFDIDFPPGTKVQDEIKDMEYIVMSTEED